MLVPRVTPIVPVAHMDEAITFFTNLSFASPPEPAYPDYVILHHSSGIDVHLRLIDTASETLDPLKNTMGIYLYVDRKEVDRLATVFAGKIIEKCKCAEVKEWGMYEFSLDGPGGCLIRVGCGKDDGKSTSELERVD